MEGRKNLKLKNVLEKWEDYNSDLENGVCMKHGFTKENLKQYFEQFKYVMSNIPRIGKLYKNLKNMKHLSKEYLQENERVSNKLQEAMNVLRRLSNKKEFEEYFNNTLFVHVNKIDKIRSTDGI